MKKTLTEKNILDYERKLKDYQGTSQLVWNEIIKKSWFDLQEKIMNSGFDPRLLQVPLSLSESFSSVDYGRRSLFVIEASVSSETIVTLSGANTSTATGTEIAQLKFDTGGTYKTQISDFYKYYKVDDDDETCYMLESVYEYLHKILACAYAFLDLMKTDDDYAAMHNYYMDMFTAEFMQAVNSGRFVVDVDESETIEESEGEDTAGEVIIGLGGDW